MTPPQPAERPADERSLIAAARAGDTGAFRTLVERHQARAYTLALRIVRSAHDAEEVTQDAFVKAWHALAGFREEAAFGTWLHRIVARRALDKAEVLKRRRAREVNEEAAALAAAPEPVGDVLEARQLHALMSRALSPAQRGVLTLYYLEGRSVEQVGEALGLNENTVKTHLARARTALRLALLAEQGSTT